MLTTYVHPPMDSWEWVYELLDTLVRGTGTGLGKIAVSRSTIENSSNSESAVSHIHYIYFKCQLMKLRFVRKRSDGNATRSPPIPFN
jgi:hypothetical protein